MSTVGGNVGGNAAGNVGGIVDGTVGGPELDGVLQELTQPEGREDPYPRYEALRAAGPLVRAPDGVLVATRYADCSALLRDPHCGHSDPQDLFGRLGLDLHDHPGIGLLATSMLNLNPPQHTRLRRLVSGAFTPRRVAALRSAVQALVDGLVERLTGEVDFVEAFAFPLPVAVIGELLGVPPEDRPAFQPLVRDWTLLLDVFTPEILSRADAAAAEIRDRLGALADERRRAPRGDLLSALVRAEQAGDRLSAHELLQMAALLFAAGFETTTHLLGNGLVALLRAPDQLELLRSRPELAGSAVEELLRFDSPVQLAGRQVLAETEVAGVRLPAGQRVVTYLGAANRDPACFPDPGRLDLARSGSAPLSFGGGVHYCLGAPLARLEAQIAIPAVLQRCSEIELSGPPQRRDSLTLRGYLRLPLRVS